MYWTLEGRGAGFALSPKAMGFLERSARRHLAKQVRDPELQATLTPDYQIGCKRVLISNTFYPALTQDNVDVVTEKIVQVRPHGVVTADGVEHEADTLIFATGFEVSGNLLQMRIVGRDGLELRDVWGSRGIGAHLGMTMAGFPNLFVLLGPNTGLGHSSVVFMIESQIRYVVQAIDLLDPPRRRLPRGPPGSRTRVPSTRPDQARRHRVGVRLPELVHGRSRPQLHDLALLHVPVLARDQAAETT